MNFFYIATGRTHKRIFFDEIHYVKSIQNYVEVVTAKQKHVVHMSLRLAAEQLPREQFIKINRSYMVALKRIAEFGNDYVRLDGNELLPLSCRCSEQLRKKVRIWGKSKERKSVIDIEMSVVKQLH
jgi:two-component system LytT family response regulator